MRRRPEARFKVVGVVKVDLHGGMFYIRNIGNKPTPAFMLDAVYEALPKDKIATGFVQDLQ